MGFLLKAKRNFATVGELLGGLVIILGVLLVTMRGKQRQRKQALPVLDQDEVVQSV